MDDKEENAWSEADRVSRLSSQGGGDDSDDPERPAMPFIDEDDSLEDKARVFEKIAVETLALIALDKGQTGNARVAAANAILDRSRGKAKQSVSVSHSTADFQDMLGEILEVRRGMYPDAIEVEVIDVDKPEPEDDEDEAI